jgi:hypothetical protein
MHNLQLAHNVLRTETRRKKYKTENTNEIMKEEGKETEWRKTKRMKEGRYTEGNE